MSPWIQWPTPGLPPSLGQHCADGAGTESRKGEWAERLGVHGQELEQREGMIKSQPGLWIPCSRKCFLRYLERPALEILCCSCSLLVLLCGPDWTGWNEILIPSQQTLLYYGICIFFNGTLLSRHCCLHFCTPPFTASSNGCSLGNHYSICSVLFCALLVFPRSCGVEHFSLFLSSNLLWGKLVNITVTIHKLHTVMVEISA